MERLAVLEGSAHDLLACGAKMLYLGDQEGRRGRERKNENI